MENKKRHPIRGRILKIVIAIAAMSLAITSVFGILSMVGIQKEAEDALASQAKENLTQTLETKTLLAEQRLGKYTEIVKEFTYYVEDILANPDEYKHYDLESPDTYDTGDLVYSFALATEDLDPKDYIDETSVLANVAHRFYPVVRENRDIIQTTYFGFDNGLLLSYDDASEFCPPRWMNYNYFESSWYELGKNADKPIFTESYVDSFGRGITISCVNPIHDKDGKVIGALGMDMGITELYDYILDLDLGEGGSAFIMDGEGNIISLDSDSASAPAPVLTTSDTNRMQNFDDGIVVRDNMMYAFSTIDSVGWRLCVRIPQSEVLELADSISMDIVSSIVMFTVFFLVILATVVIVAIGFSETLTKPIIDLKKDVSEISGGKLDHRAQIHDNDEIGDLAAGFNEMAASLKDHIGTITKVTAEKERMSAELGVATKIQADMLPRDFPHNDKIELFAAMTPAKEVGGDFYDFFFVDDDHLALVMADVAGKGVPAALFCVVAKTVIRDKTLLGGDPAQILYDVNNILCRDNGAGLFITVWLGILDMKTGVVEYVNAGHEYPVIGVHGKSVDVIQKDNCPPLAAVENTEFNLETLQLSEGNNLLLYTDGVPEAKNRNGKRFGMERLVEILEENNTKSPKELVETLKGEVDAFQPPNDPFDDVTIMSVVWKGNK